jgi:hypothetical protein
LPARHCELNGPKRVSLSPLSGGRHRGEAAEREHEVERLVLAGLPRILAEPDTNPVASCVAVLSSNRSTSPELARARTTSNSQSPPP